MGCVRLRVAGDVYCGCLDADRLDDDREAFLHPIPDGLTDKEAAPLQCGGATVFTALQGISSNDTVGIMGMGGEHQHQLYTHDVLHLTNLY